MPSLCIAKDLSSICLKELNTLPVISVGKLSLSFHKQMAVLETLTYKIH